MKHRLILPLVISVLLSLVLSGCPSSKKYTEDVVAGDTSDISADVPDVDIVLPPCLADEDCGDGAICDFKMNACVECLSYADCPAGQNCVDGACVDAPGCEANGSCEEGVCDLDTGTCVDCLADAHCPDGYVCEDLTCELGDQPCQGGDCPGGLVCDGASGLCVECADSDGCAPGSFCSADHECQGDICNAGDRTCLAENVMECAADGGAWVLIQPCPENSTCLGGACVDGCVPDCLDETGAQRSCGPDGCGGACGECDALMACVDDERCLGDFLYPCVAGAQCASGYCVPYKEGMEVCTILCDGPCPADDWLCTPDSDTLPDELFLCAYEPDCTPDCEGRSCGDDGCGGVCGFCDGGSQCNAATGACVPDPQGDTCAEAIECIQGCPDMAGPDECLEACGADLEIGQEPAYWDLVSCLRDVCAGVDAPWKACVEMALAEGFCADAQRQCLEPCMPSCDMLECGYDGCGEWCGDCPQGLVCNPFGRCDVVCEPSCDGQECGDDGCGGDCGFCAPDSFCIDGRCEDVCVPACSGAYGQPPLECGPNGCGGVCGACGPQEVCEGGMCLPVCLPDCSLPAGQLRQCGDNGCGGVCGFCPEGSSCTPYGLCQDICVGSCDGKMCGDNGCGGFCGNCPSGQFCNEGACVSPASCKEHYDCVLDCALTGVTPDPFECADICQLDFDSQPGQDFMDVFNCIVGVCGFSYDFDCIQEALLGECQEVYFQCIDCQPACDNKQCGPDGCGTTCGSCVGNHFCNDEGICIPSCEPQCFSDDGMMRECGPDSCGGVCGVCHADELCEFGACVPACLPECANQSCGSDGCGGVCGLCPSGFDCQQGACVPTCVPECIGPYGQSLECGSDGCGGVCGLCKPGEDCVNGSCIGVCEPQCFTPWGEFKDCGPDGCGGSCGFCPPGAYCSFEGFCEGSCEPQCWTDTGQFRECGPDGCNGVCGYCPPGESCQGGFCSGACVPQCVGRQCGSDSCGGYCGICSEGTYCDTDWQCAPLCQPSCAGRECGSDGCGGQCGNCDADSYCGDGQCEPFVSCSDLLDCMWDCGDFAGEQCYAECWDYASPEAQIQYQEYQWCLIDICGYDGPDECYEQAFYNECQEYYYGCLDCTANCQGRQCGPDGCGGSCGQCENGLPCDPYGQCPCVPYCYGRECGPDSCGGDCGTCEPGLSCTSGGDCVCLPNCAGKDCGSDGCGGACGQCQPGDVCAPDGQCIDQCQPQCMTPFGMPAECGSDGCGGVCGYCPDGMACQGGICTGGDDCGGISYEGCCEGNTMLYCEGGQLVEVNCADNPLCGWSQQNNWYDCGTSGQSDPSGQFPMSCDGCESNCSDVPGPAKECGADGCGGVCGFCAAGEQCISGYCYGGCIPECLGKQCGADGCGDACGSCPPGTFCNTSWQCEALCSPACAGKDCGPDGCGGYCGNCGAADFCQQGSCEPFIDCATMIQCSNSCNDDEQCQQDCWQSGSPEARAQWQSFQFCLIEACGPDAPDSCYQEAFVGQCKDYYYACLDCTPKCLGLECGPDGCGGTCGDCPAGVDCEPQGYCACQPYCAGHDCGSDGCGGSCGQCPADLSCSSNGQCICLPDCSGQECGPDGCNGSCGLCPPGAACMPSGQCEDSCEPDCSGMECGSDGCGGICGLCDYDQSCVVGVCSDPCSPNCWDKQCGSDGCGGNCGQCAEDSFCGANNRCRPLCKPNCEGRTCGPDSCGGSCGSCSYDENCINGGCRPFVSCSDILDCSWSCDDGDDACNDACFNAGSPAAKQQWFGLWICLSENCETNPQDDYCVMQALSGVCKDPYYECLSCTENCQGKQCGPDGCGGTCGSCPGGVPCDEIWGLCECVPDCTRPNGAPMECGSDGCGGSCGTCEASEVCTYSGLCVCQPSCDDKQCGTDGCGGTCGQCPQGWGCSYGFCEPPCEPSCDQMECGYDCKGDWCGDCPPGAYCTDWGYCEYGGGDGCEPHPWPGCDNCDCEDYVCQMAPECCFMEWHDGCVELCHEVGGCGGGCTPGCDEMQCGYDCNGEWCGNCPAGFTCTDNGFCQYGGGKTCTDIAECAFDKCLGGFIPDMDCFNECANGADEQSQQMFWEVFQCVLPYCMQSPDPECVYGVLEQQCADVWQKCQFSTPWP